MFSNDVGMLFLLLFFEFKNIKKMVLVMFTSTRWRCMYIKRLIAAENVACPQVISNYVRFETINADRAGMRAANCDRLPSAACFDWSRRLCHVAPRAVNRIAYVKSTPKTFEIRQQSRNVRARLQRSCGRKKKSAREWNNIHNVSVASGEQSGWVRVACVSQKHPNVVIAKWVLLPSVGRAFSLRARVGARCCVCPQSPTWCTPPKTLHPEAMQHWAHFTFFSPT